MAKNKFLNLMEVDLIDRQIEIAMQCTHCKKPMSCTQNGWVCQFSFSHGGIMHDTMLAELVLNQCERLCIITNLKDVLLRLKAKRGSCK